MANHEPKVQSFDIRFNNFCEKEVIPFVKDMEGDRQKTLKIISIIWVVFIVFALICIAPLFIPESKASCDLQMLILIIAAPFILSYVVTKKYQSEVKVKIISKVLSFVGDFQLIRQSDFKDVLRKAIGLFIKFSGGRRNHSRNSFSRRNHMRSRHSNRRSESISILDLEDFMKDEKSDAICSYTESLELFPLHTSVSCDDYITGTYHGIDMDIIELELINEEDADVYIGANGGNLPISNNQVFKGLFITFKSFKKFEGYTVIKADGLFKEKEGRVHLEDPEFEKLYDVYSTDQIEARYLLTPAFMNRLVQLSKKTIGKNLIMSFEHGNVNIAVASQKDWFEVDLKKKVTDMENYKDIVKDLYSILSIVDVLKLDQNIGM